MPSIVWFPMALVLFGLNEKAITFVVVIGAAPSIANGIVSGADQVPTVLLRAGTSARRQGLRPLEGSRPPRLAAVHRRAA